MLNIRLLFISIVLLATTLSPVNVRGFELSSSNNIVNRQRISIHTNLYVNKQPSEENNNNDIGNNGIGINGLSAGEYSNILVNKKFLRRTRRSKETNSILNLQREMEENEDGYRDMMKPYRPFMRKAIRAPFRLMKRILFPEVAKEPGTLILVRHGESLWNSNKTFTGWADPDLSERGRREAEHAARLILEGGYEIDVVFTSRLRRAIRSTWIILQELNKLYLPLFKTWRLNERMYGALTGLSKFETAERLGAELVQEWRGSLKSRPPALKPSDIYWPGRDRRYSDLSASQIPLTESLLDSMERVKPVWEDKITYELRRGRNVLVVAHANTLRGLVKIIDNVGDVEIQDVSIPTGIPIVYKFKSIKKLDSVPTLPDSASGANQVHMNGLFLEKPGLLKEALKREEEWCATVPGYNMTMTKTKTPMTALERSLNKLLAERELGQWAGTLVDPTAEFEDDGNDGNFGRPINFVQDQIWEEGIQELTQGGQFDPDAPNFHETKPSPTKNLILSEDIDGEDDFSEESPKDYLIMNSPCQKPLPTSFFLKGISSVPTRRDPTIVIIRHGKTEHNKLGLFTGWEDAPLAPEGVEEAKAAGKLLKDHGFEFDVVYTSWLSRAIETALYVADELDCLWLPIVKTWRLNERMYGALTGLSKQMVKQRHGEAQFKAWRRGYKVRPPPISSFSPDYPGNDMRYVKFMRDIRYSVSESLIRSIEGKQPKLVKKFPKSESLYDCMDRTIPYFIQQILPKATNDGKRILIASSENAIRGLLMHLCDIPEEKIVELEIPNGLPIIFDVKSKCVKLLDDGSGIDPLEKYNFGKAASYLFRPCKNPDGSLDEECSIQYLSNDLELSEKDSSLIVSIKGPKVLA